MESVLKIIDLGKKGISGPLDLFVIVLSIILVLTPAVLNLNKIISLNEFDRLFIPKHERNIQWFIQKIFDYLMFSIIYFTSGYILSIFINAKTLKGEFGEWFIIIVLLLFIISFLGIIPRVIINGWFQELNERIVNWANRTFEKNVFTWFFNIQLFLSFIVYTFFLGNPKLHDFYFQFKYYIVLFFLPCFLLYSYRAYNKKSIHEYVCQVIDQQEFNTAKPIIKYSLDQDKTVFSSKEKDQLILFDKSCGLYFTFERVKIGK
jgi:hypothetical protein